MSHLPPRAAAGLIKAYKVPSIRQERTLSRVYRFADERIPRWPIVPVPRQHVCRRSPGAPWGGSRRAWSRAAIGSGLRRQKRTVKMGLRCSAVSRAYFLLCVAAATASKHRPWYFMARSQIRPRIGVRCGP